MILSWNVQTLVTGFLFGLGISLLFLWMADDILQDIREDTVDDEVLNSGIFETFFKIGISLLIVVCGTLLVGPIFGLIYRQVTLAPQILGLNSKLVYIFLILIFSILLDIAILGSKISFSFPRILMNTWTFITCGIILPVLWTYFGSVGANG